MNNATGQLLKVLVLLAWALSATCATLVRAESAPAAVTAAPMSPDAVSALVSKLEPDELAALGHLLQRLGESGNKVDKFTTDESNIGAILETSLAGFQTSVTSNLLALPDLLAGIGSAIGAVFLGRGADGLMLFIAFALATLAVGAGIEWLFNRLLATVSESALSTFPSNIIRQHFLRVCFVSPPHAFFLVHIID